LRRSIIDTREYEREKLKLSKIRAILKEVVLLMKEGTRQAYADVKWLIGVYRNKEMSMLTGFELRERYRILYDFFKFLPFSFFLIVPGSELFLPLYLLLFPNSYPTWYIFDHVWDTNIERLEQK
jgi:LETM1 and EF-hand domain-containing protein 1